MTRPCVRFSAGAAIAVVGLVHGDAAAQTWVIGGDFGVGSGLEMGDPGSGGSVMRRARTRVVGGVTLRNSETLEQGVGVVLFGEIEPHTSFGGEARYGRWLGANSYAFVGATAVFAPHWLLGAVGGIQFGIPLGRTVGIFIEPSFSAVPFGSDLGNDRPIFWGLVSVGAHFDLTELPHAEAK